MNKYNKIILLVTLLACIGVINYPKVADAVATKLLLARQDDWVAGDLLAAPANPMTTGKYLVNIPAVATTNVLKSGGVGVAPSYGKVVLTTDVSGILPKANGGTGVATGWDTIYNSITPSLTHPGTTAAETTVAPGTANGSLTFLGATYLVNPGSRVRIKCAVPYASDADGDETLKVLFYSGSTLWAETPAIATDGTGVIVFDTETKVTIYAVGATGTGYTYGLWSDTLLGTKPASTVISSYAFNVSQVLTVRLDWGGTTDAADTAAVQDLSVAIYN